MKKVLFVVSQIGTGGAERVISTLASYCADKGYDTTIIVFRDAEKNYPISDKVKIIKIKDSGNKATSILHRIRFIRRFIKENLIDVYVTFEINYGFSCALGTKAKYITSMRNDPNSESVSLREKVLRKLNFLMANYVVFQTQEIMDYFSKSIKKHGIIIMNPLKRGLNEFHGDRNKEIVAVCRLEKQKNIPMMLKSFKYVYSKHPDYCLKIYGDGSLREDMEKLAVEYGINDAVYFMGFQDKIDEKIRDAAMYICTSDYEGLSNSLLEAMAIGLPCVSTDSGGGGAKSVIKNGENGYLVPVGDAEKMQECMNYLIEHPDDAIKISNEAVKIKDKLSENIICAQWEKLF